MPAMKILQATKIALILPQNQGLDQSDLARKSPIENR